MLLIERKERARMQKQKKKTSTGKKLAVAIIIVAILLIIALIALFLILSHRYSGTVSVAPDNIIQSSEEKLSLGEIYYEGSSRFSVENMFPGDSETQNFFIEIKDDGIKAVSFGVEINGIDLLSQVLMLRITVDGAENIIYDGAMFDLPERLSAPVSSGSVQAWQITAYLDTSVGNEYANADLSADFVWWVDDADYVSSSEGDGDVHGGVPCCNICRYICLWCIFSKLGCRGFCPWCWLIPLIILIIILVIIILILLKRKKENVITLEELMENYAPMEKVTPGTLKEKGLLDEKAKEYKVTEGERKEMDRPLTVYATEFSEKAEAAITASGGKAIKIERGKEEEGKIS